jgi:hypothetical protein
MSTTYEKRIYSVTVGQMAEATGLCSTQLSAGMSFARPSLVRKA